MFKKLPIKATAPILVGLPTLLLGTWLSIAWSRNSQDAIRQIATQSIQEIHTLVSTRVQDELAMPMRVTQLNEHLISTGMLDPKNLVNWRDLFYEQSQDFEMLSSVAWGGNDGRAAWISRYADGYLYWAIKDDADDSPMLEWKLDDSGASPVSPTNQYAYDLFSRPWYRSVIDAGSATWSDPFLWVGGEDGAPPTLGISYGVPVRDDNDQMLGIIDADFSLKDLSKFLNSIQVSERGFLALIDPHGKLVAGSGVIKTVSETGEQVSIGDPVNSALSAASRSVYGADSIRGKHPSVMVNDESYFLRTSSVGSELGLDWLLVTMAPEDDFLGEIKQSFRNILLQSILIMIATALVGVYAGRWLVAPLVRISDGVRRISGGDLDTTLDIHHAPEYTNLANEINEMTAGLRDRMRMRKSLLLAQEVQKNLLPAEDPTINGLQVAGHSTYCDETGGDYYDFLDVSGDNDHQAMIALGDVMGHGVAAAMLMATARGILRSRSSLDGSLADFLEHLNNLLVPDTRGQRFMTMLLLIADSEKQTIRWASAGHGPPIIYDSINDQVIELEGGGIPLGLVDETDYQEYVIDNVTSGYVILCATDGVWEASGSDGEQFGIDRVYDFLKDHAELDAKSIADSLHSAVALHEGPDGKDDDMTFVVIKIP
ncbi:MAG: SpoIIE family protein phosphatase [Phycisphaerales bacterium]